MKAVSFKCMACTNDLCYYAEYATVRLIQVAIPYSATRCFAELVINETLVAASFSGEPRLAVNRSVGLGAQR